MRRILFAYALFVLAKTASGLHADRFVQLLAVDSESSGETKALVFGNPSYGYFQTTELAKKNGKVIARIVPPGYRFPLEVYLRQRDADGKDRLIRRPDTSFVYPLGESEFAPPKFDVEGEMTSPFFVGNARTKIGGKEAFPAMMMNRQGELIWLYATPQERETNVIKPLANGQYGVLNVNFGMFDIVDFDGTIIRHFSYEGKTRLHHDFIYDGKDSLLTFSVRGLDFPGSAQSILEPGRYAVSWIAKLDLQAEAATKLWDAFDDGPMLHGPGSVPLHAFPVEIGTGQPPAQFDYDHINSLNWSPGRGYLVSMRTYNTVLLLDESFRLKWSLGSGPGNSISTAGTPGEFFGQHHPSFLPNGDILLFDNGTVRSRVLQLRVDDGAQSFSVVKEYMPRLPILSTSRGAVTRLANENTVAFFPRNHPDKVPSYLVEFGAKGEQVAQIAVPEEVMYNGYRFVPIDTIGRETYLGKTLEGKK